MKTIKWYSALLAGLVAGTGLGAGITATAAVGDLVYEAGGEEVEITGAEAACFADCAIAAEVWTGDRADMIRACAWRTDHGTGFAGLTIGLKSAAPGSLPVTEDGVRVVGVVE